MNGEYRKKTYNRPYVGASTTKPYTGPTIKSLSADLEVIKEMLRSVLLLSGNNFKRVDTFPHADNDKRQNKVVQISATVNEEDGFPLRKTFTKREMDGIYEEREGSHGLDTGTTSPINK